MAGKSLDSEDIEAVRSFAQRIVEADFGGKVTPAAKAFGVSQPYLSEILNRKRGGGMKLLRGLARHTGKSFDEILGRGTAPSSTVVYDQRYPNMQRGARGAATVLGITEAQAMKLAKRLLDSDEDPSPEWWFDQIRAAHNRVRKGTSVGIRPLNEDD